MSQGFSEKPRTATGQSDGSNLVYCPTITYTYKQKGCLYEYVICAGAENPNAATGMFQNVPLPPPFLKYKKWGYRRMSVPNQRVVQIVQKEPKDKHHLYAMYNQDALQQAMTKLKGSGLKMWLYINKNQDNNRFELSRQACEDWGSKKDSYYDGFNDLVKHGYLRPSKEGSNVYHFFENALAENPPSGYLEFYLTENTTPAT